MGQLVLTDLIEFYKNSNHFNYIFIIINKILTICPSKSLFNWLYYKNKYLFG